MMDGHQLRVQAYDPAADGSKTLLLEEAFRGPVELGRQKTNYEPVFRRIDTGQGHYRVAIAKLKEDGVSRRHAWAEVLLDGRVRIKNLSSTTIIRWPNGTQLLPGEEVSAASPVTIMLGAKIIVLDAAGSETDDDRSMMAVSDVTRPPGSSVPPKRLEPIAADMSRDLQDVIQRLRDAMDVIQANPHASDYESNVVKAVADIISLDTAQLLIHEGEKREPWRVKAASVVPDARAGLNSGILQKVLAEKRTFIKNPSLLSDPSNNLDCIVAAPILNGRGDVIAVLYGERKRKADLRPPRPINPLEAKLVEMMAMGIAGVLAQIETIRISGFFSPETLEYVLANGDEFLKGHEREISVLFCDIRRFGAESEWIGPAKTMEWIQNVMGELSQCVLDQQGTVVDFVGDELIAMWGAPRDQPDHAMLACEAGLNMLKRVAKLAETWKNVLRMPMAVSIGINSGKAVVGNNGAKQRMKYGPIGNEVNRASRAQCATRQVKVRFLITEFTHRLLNGHIPARRIGAFQNRNLDVPITLYEPCAGDQPRWLQLQADYETALGFYENKQFKSAARILSKLMADNPDDGPTMFLLSRAVRNMVEEPENFCSVFEI